jgi:hypothetical protein
LTERSQFGCWFEFERYRAASMVHAYLTTEWFIPGRTIWIAPLQCPITHFTHSQANAATATALPQVKLVEPREVARRHR